MTEKYPPPVCPRCGGDALGKSKFCSHRQARPQPVERAKGDD